MNVSWLKTVVLTGCVVTNIGAAELTQLDVVASSAHSLAKQGFDLTPANIYVGAFLAAPYNSHLLQPCEDEVVVKCVSPAVADLTELESLGAYVIEKWSDSDIEQQVYTQRRYYNYDGRRVTLFEDKFLTASSRLNDTKSVVKVHYIPEYTLPSSLASMGFDMEIASQIQKYSNLLASEGQITISYKLNFHNMTIDVVAVDTGEVSMDRPSDQLLNGLTDSVARLVEAHFDLVKNVRLTSIQNAQFEPLDQLASAVGTKNWSSVRQEIGQIDKETKLKFAERYNELLEDAVEQLANRYIASQQDATSEFNLELLKLAKLLTVELGYEPYSFQKANEFHTMHDLYNRLMQQPTINALDLTGGDMIEPPSFQEQPYLKVVKFNRSIAKLHVEDLKALPESVYVDLLTDISDGRAHLVRQRSW